MKRRALRWNGKINMLSRCSLESSELRKRNRYFNLYKLGIRDFRDSCKSGDGIQFPAAKIEDE